MVEETTEKTQIHRQNVVEALLDSSLIQQMIGNLFPSRVYDMKLIDCGNYVQVYMYKKKKTKKDNNYVLMPQKEEIYDREGVGEGNYSSTPKFNEIRGDNATRSRLKLQRLVKANEKEFLSFITLTFAENISGINEANKELNNFLTKVRKKYPNFKYVCVPEYQKRGAVHYHLLTNLSMNNDLIVPQEGKINQYDVLYWNKGFTSVYSANKVKNVAVYMSKYMTKDIDNRLFGRKRYFYSKNLIIPKEEYLNSNDNNVLEYINKLIKDKKICYNNTYNNSYNGEKISFIEYSYNIYYVNLYHLINKEIDLYLSPILLLKYIFCNLIIFIFKFIIILYFIIK